VFVHFNQIDWQHSCYHLVGWKYALQHLVCIVLIAEYRLLAREQGIGVRGFCSAEGDC